MHISVFFVGNVTDNDEHTLIISKFVIRLMLAYVSLKTFQF